jgi:hypothetical protein
MCQKLGTLRFLVVPMIAHYIYRLGRMQLRYVEIFGRKVSGGAYIALFKKITTTQHHRTGTSGTE